MKSMQVQETMIIIHENKWSLKESNKLDIPSLSLAQEWQTPSSRFICCILG